MDGRLAVSWISSRLWKQKVRNKLSLQLNRAAFRGGRKRRGPLAQPMPNEGVSPKQQTRYIIALTAPAALLPECHMSLIVRTIKLQLHSKEKSTIIWDSICGQLDGVLTEFTTATGTFFFLLFLLSLQFIILF